MEGDSNDWELLQGSSSVAEDNSKNIEEIEDVEQGMIRPDYFSLDNIDMRGVGDLIDDVSEDGSGSSGSGNPSWIEPRSDAPYGKKHSSELWSDSCSDRSEERKLVEFDVNNELGFENPAGNGVGMSEHVKRQIDLGEYSGSQVHDKLMSKYWSDSNGDKSDMTNSGIIVGEIGNLSASVVAEEDVTTFSGELINGNDPLGQGKAGEERSRGRESPAIDPSEKSSGAGVKKRVVWWKVPLELLKYCVCKVNPVWSVSVAAAVMGFVILGRRLYNMKKKSRSLQFKVKLDDKLVNRAPKLNEAISVVKRVPIIRPALPAPSINQWPAVSLR